MKYYDSITYNSDLHYSSVQAFDDSEYIKKLLNSVWILIWRRDEEDKDKLILDGVLVKMI